MGHLLTTLLITTSYPSIDTKCIYCLWVLGWPAFPSRFQKLLEENTGRTLSDINHINTFLDPSAKTKEMKAKEIITLDPIKLKSSCTAKETTDKMKREPTGEYFQMI